MRSDYLKYLCCPTCRGSFRLLDGHRSAEDRIEQGTLQCEQCVSTFPIINSIPRFVPDEGYAAGFGLQWTVHRETQYDRATGDSMSRRRFFDETRWPTRLEGEVLIEAGSGSGRFTEHALSTGAVVLSIDYSHAVESNFALNGGHANLLLVQGDLFRMPFRDGAADRLFCFGVLQHTPDPRGALASLTRCVRPGGAVVADIYAKTFARYVLGTKYWVRPITRRVAPARLYRILSRYVEFMWPLARRISRVPKLGRILNWRLLIADYSDVFADDAVLRDWAKLDTFDMLAPRYDRPATARTVARWCDELGLVSVDIRRGYNGLEFRASRASA